MKESFKYAFPLTIPIMAGYIFLGTSFGLLMSSQGYSIGYPILMSVVIYGGSMQFAAIGLFSAAFNPIGAFLLTLMVHARHIFYGITMLKPFKDLKQSKLYTMFALTDETFSLLVSLDPPATLDKSWLYFHISWLNQIYWITGTAIGALVGSNLSFNTEGIEFVLTALFVVIFIDQWLSSTNHQPALIGLFGSLAALLVFGPSQFMIPAMIIIIGIFSTFYTREGQANDE